jgi:hypothetical protein
MEEVKTTTTSSSTEDYVDGGGFWKTRYEGMHGRITRLEDHNAILMLVTAGVIAYLLLMG